MTPPRLLQHKGANGRRRLILAEGPAASFLSGPATVRELALEVIEQGDSLAAVPVTARAL